MNYNFNDQNIVTGYIKELLHNFNLPVVPIYTKDTILYENRTYINDISFCKALNGSLVSNIPYLYGRKYLNLTSNLDIKSNLYDTETHEYLGNYLRFIRDYNKINLMPLYNCFSNRKLENVNEDFTIRDKNTFENKKYTINTYSGNSIYYLIPVKFNKEYTVAINCLSQYDIFCVLYKNGIINQVKENGNVSYEKLISNTLTKVSGSTFYNPFIYKTSYDASDLWQMENCLYMVIKLPKNISSSIVILEGNYLDITKPIGSNISSQNFNDSGELLLPKTIDNSLLPTKLSLLTVNNNISYPFADRLVEYLLNNVIASKETIEYNILRLQENLMRQGTSSKGFIHDIWTDKIKEGIYKFLVKNKSKTKDDVVINEESHFNMLLDNYNDILNYGDKDVEIQLQEYRS